MNSACASENLLGKIRMWASELGFSAAGISPIQLTEAEHRLNDWLDAGMHGEMDYMSRHGTKRSRPELLEPGTLSIISVRMDYYPEQPHAAAFELLEHPEKAYISRYALGRDYHKLMRRRLVQLAEKISHEVGNSNYRVFVDSAPVMEKPIAQLAGLGWIGKHSNLIHHKSGSWFFLGEIYTNLPLPIDSPAVDHCGRCNECIKACPTNAIVEPYVVDARLCISYLTIETQSPIPHPLRKKMGNRIYGCDDCQLVCPWNRFTETTAEQDFKPRHDMDNTTLVQLFSLSEDEFLQLFEGSPVRRIGHLAWLRNIAVALGNALADPRVKNIEAIIQVLQNRLSHPSEMLKEHIHWALAQQRIDE